MKKRLRTVLIALLLIAAAFIVGYMIFTGKQIGG